MSLLLALSLSVAAPAPFDRHARPAPDDDDAQTHVINQRRMEIPLRVRPDVQNDLKEVQLHFSADRGRTWTLSSAASPDKSSFVFVAPNDGLYLFKLRVVFKDGHAEPTDLTKSPPNLKVRVRSKR